MTFPHGSNTIGLIGQAPQAGLLTFITKITSSHLDVRLCSNPTTHSVRRTRNCIPTELSMRPPGSQRAPTPPSVHVSLCPVILSPALLAAGQQRPRSRVCAQCLASLGPSARRCLACQDLQVFPGARSHHVVCWTSDSLAVRVPLPIPGGNRLLLRLWSSHSFIQHPSVCQGMFSSPGLGALATEPLANGTSPNASLLSREMGAPPHLTPHQLKTTKPGFFLRQPLQRNTMSIQI